MKHETRPAIYMEKQFVWVCKLGGAESLGISKAGVCVSQVDGVSDVHQLASSVALWRKGSEKGQ